MFEAVKVWPGKGEACRRLVRRPTLTASARAGVGEVRVGTKKRAFRSNKENRRRKKDAPPCRLLKLLLDKAPYKGNRAGGTCAGAARSAYGDLRAGRNLNGRRFSRAVGLEYEYNLDVTARILLDGDLSFRPTCDFKELGVAKISRAIPCRL